MKRIVSVILLISFICLAFVSCRDEGSRCEDNEKSEDKASIFTDYDESDVISVKEIVGYLNYIDGMIKDTEADVLPKLYHNGTEYTWEEVLSNVYSLAADGLGEDELISYTHSVFEHLIDCQLREEQEHVKKMPGSKIGQ